MPKVPECCLDTPGEAVPPFGNPVSYTTRTCGRTTATARRASLVRTVSTCQADDVMNCCDC
ncbi:hypothetical protein PUR35_01205 [Streptomyces sp. JV184]|nr:hypothetical protein [Streptomyces sp. JV184]MEE1743031.1 hypothetical protein [Streptomyces sp. JV184]